MISGSILTRLTATRATLLVQIQQSATSLVATAAFVGVLHSSQFGLYAIAQASALLMVGMIDSGVLVPALVRLSQHGARGGHRRMLLALPTLVGLALLGSLAVFFLLVLTLPLFGAPVQTVWQLAATTAGLGAALSLREVSRQSMLLRRSTVALVASEAASSLLLLCFVAAWFYLPGLGARTVVGAILLMCVAGVLPLLMLAREWIRSGHSMRIQWFGSALMRRGAWSFAASQITWVQSQTYLYFVSAMLSPSAAGVLASARLIFQPLQTAVTGLSRGLLAELAANTGPGRWQEANRRMRRFFLWLVLISLVWLALSFALRPQLEFWLRDKGYAFDSALLISWSAVFLFSGARAIVTQVLRAAGHFRQLTSQGFIGAVASLVVIPSAILAFGATGAVAGLATIEAMTLLIGLRLVSTRKDDS